MNSYRKYQNDDCDDICDFPAICQMPIYHKTDWLPPKKAQFEDIEVNIPNNYDKEEFARIKKAAEMPLFLC